MNIHIPSIALFVFVVVNVVLIWSMWLALRRLRARMIEQSKRVYDLLQGAVSVTPHSTPHLLKQLPGALQNIYDELKRP